MKSKSILVLFLLFVAIICSNAQLKVNSDGEVGIGTDPSEKLHINGSIRGDQQDGALKIQTDEGYIGLGPYNSSFSHFYTDMDQYYFNKSILVNSGEIGSYDEDLVLGTWYGSYLLKRIWIERNYHNCRVGINDATPS